MNLPLGDVTESFYLRRFHMHLSISFGRTYREWEAMRKEYQ